MYCVVAGGKYDSIQDACSCSHNGGGAPWAMALYHELISSTVALKLVLLD